MTLEELEKIIRAAGGGTSTLDYAPLLLKKINLIQGTGRYKKLLEQVRAAREQGDLRGRLLEVNFLNSFVSEGVHLDYEVKQGMPGDVDFCWRLNGLSVFIEMKLLGQDKKTQTTIDQQLQASGFSSITITDDVRDVARIQRDIFGKSSTKKFKYPSQPQIVNLVAIDVSELQLGTVDMCDCVLAAAGNEEAKTHFDSACMRSQVVGVFERVADKVLTTDQSAWVKNFHPSLGAEPHPNDYIHGVMFIFREPAERAALSYGLRARVVWNSRLIGRDVAEQICKSLNQFIPHC